MVVVDAGCKQASIKCQQCKQQQQKETKQNEKQQQFEQQQQQQHGLEIENDFPQFHFDNGINLFLKKQSSTLMKEKLNLK